jgi:GTP-binding protein
MFIDETLLRVKAGDGGNGCYAHERSKSNRYGRPSGGSGGRGGNIYLRADPHVRTLRDVAYHKSYKAGRGANGKGGNKDGKHGDDVVIVVPRGTVVYDDNKDEMIRDIVDPGATVLAAAGGKGGKGNAALVSRRNPDPARALAGKPGEEKTLKLCLKVLADVGLVGRPNAGKSTFLSRISRARPRIADYPFTTTSPYLGIAARVHGFGSYVVADIPGLIEGSHEGKGMGLRFLRHVERTRILVMLVESTREDPVDDVRVLREELKAYSPLLAEKPFCVVLTKTDLLGTSAPPGIDNEWCAMSAMTGQGLDRVRSRIEHLLDSTGGQQP